MLDPAIDDFFAERKKDWLKKHIKDDMDETKIREKEQECEQIFLLKNWLPDAAKRICSRALTTHPSKFSHPSTGVGKTNKKDGTFVTPVCLKALLKLMVLSKQEMFDSMRLIPSVMPLN